MENTVIAKRMEAILEELSQHKQFENCYPVLEADGDKGDILLTLKGNYGDTERFMKYQGLIKATDDLSHLRDIFNYSHTLTSRTIDINPEGVKMAYFDNLGDLVVDRSDSHFGTTEVFRLKSDQRETIIDKLKTIFGKKLKA